MDGEIVVDDFPSRVRPLPQRLACLRMLHRHRSANWFKSAIWPRNAFQSLAGRLAVCSWREVQIEFACNAAVTYVRGAR